MIGLFLLLVWPLTVIVVRVFSLPQRNQRSFLTLQYRLESSTRLTLSSLLETITGLQWKGRSLFQFLSDSSVSPLNYGSRSYDIGYVGHLWVVFATSSRSSTERNLQPQGRLNSTWTIVSVGDYDLGLCGTSMIGFCCFIAEQYWEAWGLFWKRSVSLFLLGVVLGSGFCVVVVFGFAVLFLVSFDDTWVFVSLIFSYMGMTNHNKRIDDRVSFKARTAPAKKKGDLVEVAVVAECNLKKKVEGGWAEASKWWLPTTFWPLLLLCLLLFLCKCFVVTSRSLLLPRSATPYRVGDRRSRP